MEFDSPPSRPVVKNSVSAQAEWENWLYQNKFEYLRDADGLDWSVKITFEQLPSHLDRRAGRWVATVEVALDVSMLALIETGTFDKDEDARLIDLVRDDLIPLRMRKIQYEAISENAMRDTMAQVLPELRENFRKTSLNAVKRTLVGRWIEGRMIFGKGQLDNGFELQLANISVANSKE
jgi:hypothetical protein